MLLLKFKSTSSSLCSYFYGTHFSRSFYAHPRPARMAPIHCTTVSSNLLSCGSNSTPGLSVGYLSRKALPIKRNDAEPLTREDVQYDLLYHIFSDARAVFTSPIKTMPGEPLAKVHFCDLYVNALYKSSKCSKVLKDKMVETPMFAVELAKISLLTNVGRINTTMACAYLAGASTNMDL